MFNFMKIFCRQQAWILNSLPLLQQPSGKIVTSFNLNPFISDSIGLIHLSCEMKRDSLFLFCVMPRWLKKANKKLAQTEPDSKSFFIKF